MFRSFSIYTITSIITAGINFLLMPYLSHHIDTAGYGILSLFNTYVMILGPVMSVVSYGLITVEYYRINDQAELGKLFSSIQFIPLVGFLVFLLPAFFINAPLSSALELEAGGGRWLILLPVFSLLSVYNEVFLGFLIIEKKPAFYGAVSLARTFIEVGLTLLFVGGFDWGWEGRLYAWLIAILLLFVFSFFYFLKRKILRPVVEWKYVRAGLLFGFPLLLHTIGKLIINQSDRIFITKMVTINEAGIYNVGYTVGSIILIFATAFNSAYTPFLFERLSKPDENRKKEIVRMGWLFIGLLLAALLVMSVLSPVFFRVFMDESYEGGNKYVFWTGLAYWFWGIYMVFSGVLFYFKKTGFLTFLALFNVAVNIILNYVLILNYGPIGAAWATAISFFLIMVLVIAKAQKVYRLDFLGRG